jgi:hypothetical protein
MCIYMYKHMYVYMHIYVYHRPTTGSTVGNQVVPKDTNRRATASKIDVKEVRAVSTNQKIRPTTGSATPAARTKDASRSVSTSKDKRVPAVSTDQNVRPVSTDHKKSSLNPDKNIKKSEISKSAGELLKDSKDIKPLKNIMDKNESDDKLVFPPVVKKLPLSK